MERLDPLLLRIHTKNTHIHNHTSTLTASSADVWWISSSSLKYETSPSWCTPISPKVSKLSYIYPDSSLRTAAFFQIPSISKGHLCGGSVLHLIMDLLPVSIQLFLSISSQSDGSPISSSFCHFSLIADHMFRIPVSLHPTSCGVCRLLFRSFCRVKLSQDEHFVCIQRILPQWSSGNLHTAQRLSGQVSPTFEKFPSCLEATPPTVSYDILCDGFGWFRNIFQREADAVLRSTPTLFTQSSNLPVRLPRPVSSGSCRTGTEAWKLFNGFAVDLYKLCQWVLTRLAIDVALRCPHIKIRGTSSVYKLAWGIYGSTCLVVDQWLELFQGFTGVPQWSALTLWMRFPFPHGDQSLRDTFADGLRFWGVSLAARILKFSNVRPLSDRLRW